MSANEWKVVGGVFVQGGNLIKASCHHQNKGACGGCYARLMEALQSIVMKPDEAQRVAIAVFAELRREGGR